MMPEIRKPCFKTSGVEESIPFVLQMQLWQLMFEVKENRDYLQVYDLKAIERNGENIQVIIHTQEEPEMASTHYLSMDAPVTARIYIIEDQTHFTMLLCSEY